MLKAILLGNKIRTKKKLLDDLKACLLYTSDAADD